MRVPGLVDELSTPEMLDKAEQEAARLLETLKKEVKADFQDIGTLRKRMEVTVPAQVIAEHLAHNYDELRGDAIVPGFRKGRAPLQLIQKRFGSDIRESLKTSIVGQSFFAAIENAKLEVLGDPLFQIQTDGGVKLADLDEALQHLRLPESGDFCYVCEIEIRPTFELPELRAIEIKSPVVKISDEDVGDEITRQRKIRGRYEPLPEGAAERDDLIVADVHLEVEGKQVKSEDNVQLGLRPTRLDGIPLLTLDEALGGVRPGEQRSLACAVPDDYERADLRGKTGTFRFTVHEIKRLAPCPLEVLFDSYGCREESELRALVRDDMEAELGTLARRAKKQQVYDYLLNNVPLELPESLSARQTDRAVVRRVLELQQSGVPQSEIDARIDELRTSAKQDVNRELRLEFILQKVAEKLEVEVTDEEVNTAIAQIARLYNRRFDRVRDDLQKQGLLAQLAEKIRHDKCVERLLADARIVEVTRDQLKPRKKPAKAAKSAAAETAAETAAEAEAPAEPPAQATTQEPAPKKPRSRKKKAE